MSTALDTATLRLRFIGRADLPPIEVSPGDVLWIGRSAACEACLPDPGVSRRHATITNTGQQWLLTDLASRHGTHLNGVRITPNEPSPVAAGDLIRVGSFSLRLSSDRDAPALTTTEDSHPGQTIARTVPQRELDTLAHRRLALMIDGAASIHQAGSEDELARAVIDLVLAGTAFHRAAVLRYADSPEQIEVLAHRDHHAPDNPPFTFSRSLLEATARGDVARLSESAPHAYGQSIERLDITSALCAPLMMDTAVIGAIYLDSRAGEEPAQDDAAGFCNAVARLASLALSNLKRAELARRQERLEADLKIAQNAQAFLMPPEHGTVGRIRYSAKTHPGRVVAGDLFDLFEIDRGGVAICLGDVTGQGMGAALLMTAILANLRAALARRGEPAAAVTDVNAYIARRSPENMFASLWVGVYRPGASAFRYVDAGHGHWFVKTAGDPPWPASQPGNILLGIDPDVTFHAEALELAPDDRLVLFSDGVVEHMNTMGDMFGRQRLQHCIQPSDSTAADVIHAFHALRTFLAGAPFTDDATLASIQIAQP